MMPNDRLFWDVDLAHPLPPEELGWDHCAAVFQVEFYV